MDDEKFSKKEVQAQIMPIIIEANGNKATKEEVMTILRQVTPGTHMRTGINGVVQAKKGALIVVDKPGINDIIDGGFKLNCKFTPQRLIELSKMDGAIILSNDMKRITHANVTLYPDTKIQTNETGTRHKAAERTAKMIGTLVICVSERKNEINIYYKNIKYPLKETSEIMGRATQMLNILEKQRELFDDYVTQLNIHEIYNDLNLEQACKVIQKGAAIEKILGNHEKTLIELGNEGPALKQRIKELIRGVDKEINLVIKDYTKLNVKKTRKLIEALTYEEMLDLENISVTLAQKETKKIESVKGWRILDRTILEEKDIGELTNKIGNLKAILSAHKSDLIQVLGEEKTNMFTRDIEKIKNQ